MNIVTRKQWGSRPPARTPSGVALPVGAVWLHHTAGNEPDGPGGTRQIQRFHQDSRGYNDIAYNFVVDRDGTVSEGRGPGVLGAHTKGHNDDHAICVKGHYDRDPVPPAVVVAVAELLRHGHQQGWWRRPELAGGHRDVGQTSCPGTNLYAAVAAINQRAKTPQTGTPVDAVLLVHPSTGTPDALAGLTGLFDRPDQKIALTCNVDVAKQALRDGRRVWAIGGPAADLIAGDRDLKGASRLDTLDKVHAQAAKGW